MLSPRSAETAREIRATVSAAVLGIAKRRNPALAAVEPHHHLIEDLQFDSLDIAELVAGLEMALRLDPFSNLTLSLTDCSTVGALCDAYEASAEGAAGLKPDGAS